MTEYRISTFSVSPKGWFQDKPDIGFPRSRVQLCSFKHLKKYTDNQLGVDIREWPYRRGLIVLSESDGVVGFDWWDDDDESGIEWTVPQDSVDLGKKFYIVVWDESDPSIDHVCGWCGKTVGEIRLKSIVRKEFKRAFKGKK